MKNQVGIFYDNLCDTYKDLNGASILQKAHDFGFDFVELGLDTLENQDVSFYEKLKELNMIPSVYAFTDCDCFLEDGRHITSALSMLSAYGVSNLMLVCGCGMLKDNNRDELEEKIVASVNSVCESCDKYGMGVLFEDFDSKYIPCANTSDLLHFAEKIPGLRITLDTGNFSSFGEDPIASYEKLESKVKHCHVKDKLPDGNCSVTGEGILPIKELVKNMVSDGYEGRFSIEMFGVELNDEKFKKALAYIKNTD